MPGERAKPLLIGRANPSNLWHLIHYVGSPGRGYPGEHRTACCGYRIKVGYAVVKQITFGSPTCKNCRAKLAGLRGGPNSTVSDSC